MLCRLCPSVNFAFKDKTDVIKGLYVINNVNKKSKIVKTYMEEDNKGKYRIFSESNFYANPKNFNDIFVESLGQIPYAIAQFKKGMRKYEKETDVPMVKKTSESVSGKITLLESAIIKNTMKNATKPIKKRSKQ